MGKNKYNKILHNIRNLAAEIWERSTLLNKYAKERDKPDYSMRIKI